MEPAGQGEEGSEVTMIGNRKQTEQQGSKGTGFLKTLDCTMTGKGGLAGGSLG